MNKPLPEELREPDLDRDIAIVDEIFKLCDEAWDDELADIYMAREALANIKAALEWHPIDSAPKDGTVVLGWMPLESNVGEVYWDQGQPDGPDEMGWDAGWASPHGACFAGRSFGDPDHQFKAFNQPTHWKPITPPRKT